MTDSRNANAPAKRGAAVGFGESRRCNSTAPRLPGNWRERLPDADAYYRQHVEKLSRPNATGWAQGACPFHDDRNASLSVHVAGNGGWRCFAGCGGGDLVGFHMKRQGLDFRAAVRAMIGGAR